MHQTANVIVPASPVVKPNSLRERIKKAIQACQGLGVYPSGAAISDMMGRKSKALNGRELRLRDSIFAELGLTVKNTGWRN